MYDTQSPPQREEMVDAAAIKRLGQAAYSPVMFFASFNEVRRLGLQSCSNIPCRIRASLVESSL